MVETLVPPTPNNAGRGGGSKRNGILENDPLARLKFASKDKSGDFNCTMTSNIFVLKYNCTTVLYSI